MFHSVKDTRLRENPKHELIGNGQKTEVSCIRFAGFSRGHSITARWHASPAYCRSNCIDGANWIANFIDYTAVRPGHRGGKSIYYRVTSIRQIL